MSGSENNSWLHRFSLLTAAVTLCLIAVGGLVTSHGAGMAVPDWPNSYGYNMFLFPVSKWIGGIFYEHSHRLVATLVGLLVVALTRWLGGSASRLPLAIIGLFEVLLGFACLRLPPEWRGAGHFLSGIGIVVLISAIVWVPHQPAPRPLPFLGWVAFVAVQLQGLLGGLRVVLIKNQLGIFHATLAQLFFLLLCVIALLTSRWWRQPRIADASEHRFAPGNGTAALMAGRGAVIITVLILCQLTLGATMRHQHAGLAIPDFPLAYGKLWPTMDPLSVELYNQHRLETTPVNPITAIQIGMQMTHRILALVILVSVIVFVWRVWRKFGATSLAGRFVSLWLGLVLLQAALGALTIWFNKAADIATAHVVTGALLLANGGLLCIIPARSRIAARETENSSANLNRLPEGTFVARPSAAVE
jgi:cytochrome c oxidase assembly protein subunit 15